MHIAATFFQERSTFPRYENSTVYIQIAKTGFDYRYGFDKNILARISPWFAETLHQYFEESNPELAFRVEVKTGYDTRYELLYKEELQFWILERYVSALGHQHVNLTYEL